MVALDRSLTVTVYDAGLRRTGYVNDFTELRAVIRLNAQSTLTLTVPADHRRTRELSAPGARVTLDYRVAGRSHRMLSGRVADVEGTVGPDGQRTYTVLDDFVLLSTVLGWPDPRSPVTNQAGAEYDTVTGPAETVLKRLVGANVTRLGLPVTMAPDLRRGATVSASVRMHPLIDRLLPALTEAGVNISFVQYPLGPAFSPAGQSTTPGIVLSVWTSGTHQRKLTAQSGVVTGGSWSRTPPTATRVVVGGIGEGKARDFITVADTALEQAWGLPGRPYVAEVFADARDAGQDYAKALDDEARLRETKDETVAKYVELDRAHTLAEQRQIVTNAQRETALQHYLVAQRRVDEDQAELDRLKAANAPAAQVQAQQARLDKSVQLRDQAKTLSDQCNGWYDDAARDRNSAYDAMNAASIERYDAETAWQASFQAIYTQRPIYLEELRVRGVERLAEGAAAYKLDLTYTDTAAFAYKRTYEVGDYVVVGLAEDVEVTDRVTEVEMTYTRDAGLVVSPKVGTGSDVIGAQARAVAALARGQRHLTVSV